MHCDCWSSDLPSIILVLKVKKPQNDVLKRWISLNEFFIAFLFNVIFLTKIVYSSERLVFLNIYFVLIVLRLFMSELALGDMLLLLVHYNTGSDRSNNLSRCILLYSSLRGRNTLRFNSRRTYAEPASIYIFLWAAAHVILYHRTLCTVCHNGTTLEFKHLHRKHHFSDLIVIIMSLDLVPCHAELCLRLQRFHSLAGRSTLWLFQLTIVWPVQFNSVQFKSTQSISIYST